jgi:hypothetical protein
MQRWPVAYAYRDTRTLPGMEAAVHPPRPSSSLAKCSCMYEYRECQARSRCTASLSCGQFSYHFVTFGCRLAAVGPPAAFRGQPRYFKADADWSSLGPSLGPSQRVWIKRVEGSQMTRGSTVKCRCGCCFSNRDLGLDDEMPSFRVF